METLSTTLPSLQTAHAKVNLALHVTGQRRDGYHLIDSLVTFCDFGDKLTVSAGNHEGEGIKLTITGPEGDGLSTGNVNLIVQAIEAFRDYAGSKGVKVPNGISIILDKQLPVSSGIGGGSADGAAALRGINQICGNPFALKELAAISRPLGADFPMCVMNEPSRVSGIGETLEAISMPKLNMVLVNPRISVSTPEVFGKLVNKDNSQLPDLPNFNTTNDLVSWLLETRNDLYLPALSIAPEIETVMKVLGESTKCLYHGMSGSGATCFGVFPDLLAAEHAAEAIASSRPDWWVVATTTGAG